MQDTPRFPNELSHLISLVRVCLRLRSSTIPCDKNHSHCTTGGRVQNSHQLKKKIVYECCSNTCKFRLGN